MPKRNLPPALVIIALLSAANLFSGLRLLASGKDADTFGAIVSVFSFLILALATWTFLLTAWQRIHPIGDRPPGDLTLRSWTGKGASSPSLGTGAVGATAPKHGEDSSTLQNDGTGFSESRALLAGFPQPIFMIDEIAGLIHRNPAAERLTDNAGDGHTIPTKVERLARRCMASGTRHEPKDIEHAILLREDERERWYLPAIFPVSQRSDKPASLWVIVLLEVTRVRWLDDMKTDLLGTVSHEIKTPLTSIRMVLHLLAEQKMGKLNESQESVVTSARDDCEKLLETLENLLQMARIERGESGLEPEALRPADLVEEASEALSGQIEGMRLQVITEVAENLPRVRADRRQIGQVFNNLLSNSAKHSEAGGTIRIAARLGDDDQDDFVRFSVIDHGDGIPEEAQEKIFQRFYRAPGQSDNGTGLGLAISRDIIRAHSGRIGFTSKPGVMTEFYFYLPMCNR